MVEVEPAAANPPFSWDYAVSSSAPTSGQAHQTPALNSIAFSDTDASGADRTAFLGAINTSYAITCNQQVWFVTSVAQGSGVASFAVKPSASAPPFGVRTFSFVPANTISQFPTFTPIVPPPVIGVGGGPPPSYPPPNPPPIGAIPPGVTVGPAISPAGVPPSLAGVVQPQFKTGSATAPTAASWFPQFTTTFPKPTIVVGGNNFAALNAGHIPPWTQAPPAQTASTLCIVLDGWGPGVPPGAPTAPGGDGRFPRMAGLSAEIEADEAEDEPAPKTKKRRH